MNFTPASQQIKAASVQLSVAGVGKRFGGVTAVDDVSIEVPQGRIVSIIGPNGAGKTSLLNMISGFYKPDTGRIMLEGRDITRKSPSEIAWAPFALAHQHQAADHRADLVVEEGARRSLDLDGVAPSAHAKAVERLHGALRLAMGGAEGREIVAAD